MSCHVVACRVLLAGDTAGCNRTSCYVYFAFAFLEAEMAEMPEIEGVHMQTVFLCPCSWILLCCYHSIFDFQVNWQLSASYIIPCDVCCPETDKMRTPSWSPHLYFLCQLLGHLPLNLRPGQRQTKRCSVNNLLRGLLTMQIVSSCICPVDRTKEGAWMSPKT